MKIVLKQLIKFTWLEYFFRSYNDNLPTLDKIETFWDNIRKQNINEYNHIENPIVLVEAMQKPNPNWDSYYKLAGLLSLNKNAKFITLTDYSNNKSAENFLNAYVKIEKREQIYKPFDIKKKVKSLLILARNIKCKYTCDDGIKYIIDGVNIGDLIYDEYLRVAKVETLRKKNILYYIMAYKATYAYLRYKHIIKSNNITDIIAIRDTYSHASFYRAATDNPISIWKNRSGAMSAIRKLKSSTEYNHKPFYFEEKHLVFFKKKYSKEEINERYDELIKKRAIGDVETGDSREIKLAHSKNEINTIDEFNSAYDIKSSKKTVVIYAHVFVDAVRYPHKVIFSDHYTWLVETLKFLVKLNKYNILIKPHPSECLYELGKSISSVVKELNEELGVKMIILDKKVDFNVIKSISDVIITGSGTIAMEAPCEGVKVITAGSSSYENTNAMFRNSSQEEYFECLRNIDNLPKLSSDMMINSKIGFIWLNKYMYVKSESCIGFEKDLCAFNDFERLNEHYRNLDFSSIKPLLERMYDDDIN